MNLTESILKAKSYLIHVQIEEIILSVEELAIKFNFLINWDKDDGEQWGRLFQEKKMIALFNAKLPLLLVDSEFNSMITGYYKNNSMNNLVIISVDSWESENYCINPCEVLDTINWHSSAISAEKFSINDFWFATI